MIVLLDTHTFIWWDSSPGELSSRLLGIISDPANTVLLSVVSVWEMQIKASIGKLLLRGSVGQLVSEQQVNGLVVIPVELADVLAIEHLPTVHHDPFDRLLIAQSITRNAPLLSKDSRLRSYPAVTI